MREEQTNAADDAAASAADLRSITRLFEAAQPRVLAYIVRHLPAAQRRVVAPDDVLIDTFFAAWRAIHTFRSYADPRALERWLLTIARNQIRDQIRAGKAAKRDLGRTEHCAGGAGGAGGAATDDEDTDFIENALEQLAVYRRTPSQSVLALELLAVVEEAVARLPEDQAQVVRLRHLEDLPWEQVAARMRRSRAAVRRLCERALGALSRDLGSTFFSGEAEGAGEP